jgi:hypothetical protein
MALGIGRIGRIGRVVGCREFRIRNTVDYDGGEQTVQTFDVDGTTVDKGNG